MNRRERSMVRVLLNITIKAALRRRRGTLESCSC